MLAIAFNHAKLAQAGPLQMEKTDKILLHL